MVISMFRVLYSVSPIESNRINLEAKQKQASNMNHRESRDTINYIFINILK